MLLAVSAGAVPQDGSAWADPRGDSDGEHRERERDEKGHDDGEYSERERDGKGHDDREYSEKKHVEQARRLNGAFARQEGGGALPWLL